MSEEPRRMNPAEPELRHWQHELDCARVARDPDLAVSVRIRDPRLETPEQRHRATIEERDWWLLNDREALSRANRAIRGDLSVEDRSSGPLFTSAELHLLSTILLQWLTLVEGPPVNLDEQMVARIKAIQRKAIESAFMGVSR